MACPQGTITLWQPTTLTGARERARYCALAGVSELDGLERLVPVRTVVREQLAWATSWWKHTPRPEDSDYPALAQLLDLDITLDDTVDDLRARDRFLLRIVLALLSRPDASLLIVDDIDQVKSMTVRDEVFFRLKNLSQRIPVIVNSSNPDTTGTVDRALWISPEERDVEDEQPSEED
ncbi:hypothetical protein L1O03_05040 [Corynebacterium uropygiale]|uniref:Uncharacterized protein n=1 Tax=Corynebacterium uropygiale TaxID=1775911 RepID=A0A9X1U0J2_9CORY|nr:hypothetical protein [Corynebacterium uropygiale]MCF4006543.1 hypothetical protein [Corynebacterium uropygiale]